MPPRFLVRGGRPLRGTVRPAGNKNAALPILAATVLADGVVELDNIPRIRDVETMLAVLLDLGAQAEWTGAEHPADRHPVAPAQTARSRALRQDPRVDPARRADARAVRRGHPAAARRRRHRPAAGGHPFPRAGAARRLGDGGRPLRAGGQGAHRRRHLPRRAQRHRHRERAHGRRDGQGPHRAPERGLRAPRAGPRPRRWWRWAPRSRASAPTSTPSRAGGRSAGRATPSAPTTSRSAASSASPP